MIAPRMAKHTVVEWSVEDQWPRHVSGLWAAEEWGPMVPLRRREESRSPWNKAQFLPPTRGL
jgi:hypothetical protein